MIAALKKSPPTEAEGLARVEALADTVRELVRDAKSWNTRRAYRADWTRFLEWCGENLLDPLPAKPEAVALYLAHRANQGRKLSTLRRELVAISQAHKAKGFEPPTTAPIVRESLKGLARKRAKAGERTKKAPAVRPHHLRAMVETFDLNKLRGLRDRALLLVGFAGAFRRSELVALDMEDLLFEPEGLRVTIRLSKTDQSGEGRTFGIARAMDEEMCPVGALEAWIESAGITEGPAFRSFDRRGRLAAHAPCDKTVDRVLKKASIAAAIGIPVSAHSLRSGMITTAIARGARPDRVRAVSGHKSERVFSGYVREGSIWADNATRGLLG